MGYVTSVSFAHALKDWAETHRWSFTTMTKAAVMLHGDPATLMLNSNTPCFMAYTVVQNTTNTNGCPATLFRIDSVAIITPDDYKNDNGFLLRAYQDAEAGRRAMDASFRRDGDPAFAGVISVVYILKDTGMAVHNQHPVYRARRGPLDEPTQTMVRDLLGLCKGSVNAGCALRMANDYARVPTPGLMVRVKKTWEWVPLLKQGQSWNTLAKHLLPLYKVQSGLLPDQLFERFALL